MDPNSESLTVFNVKFLLVGQDPRSAEGGRAHTPPTPAHATDAM